MTWRDALLLGRVSNLPTVWTNALAGMVLAGFEFASGGGGVLKPAFAVLAMSLFYLGGMYLNDAFDAGIDARERPERPIPSGRAARQIVFIAGYGLVILGVAAALLAASFNPAANLLWPGAAALSLAAAIIFYNWHHKANPFSPFVMGLCRALVYVTAGLCVVFPLPDTVLYAACIAFCYLIGLTFVARHEHLGRVTTAWPLVLLAAPLVYGCFNSLHQPWVFVFTGTLAIWVIYCVSLVLRGGPFVAKAVANLIAGIALCDAIFLASAGAVEWSIIAAVCFVLTLAFQRVLPGT